MIRGTVAAEASLTKGCAALSASAAIEEEELDELPRPQEDERVEDDGLRPPTIPSGMDEEQCTQGWADATSAAWVLTATS